MSIDDNYKFSEKIVGDKDYSETNSNYFTVCLTSRRRITVSPQYFTKIRHTEALRSEQNILLQLRRWKRKP